MPFVPGNSGNPAGRPRGRISKFRKLIGEATDDGAEIRDRLLALMRDPETPAKEVRETAALLLAYFLGKPETVVSGKLDVTAHQGAPHAVVGRILDLVPPELVARVTDELVGQGEPLLLAPGEVADDD